MHAREQFLEGERLHEEIVRAAVERVDARADRVARAEDEDGNVRARGSDLCEDFDSVEIREAKIEDDNVSVLAEHVLERGFSGAVRNHMEAFLTEPAPQRVGEFGAVLDENERGVRPHCHLVGVIETAELFARRQG